MTHPDQPSGAPEQPASAQRADDTAPIPWARTTTMPTVPAPSRDQAPAPALAPPVWSGRKTAIAAALAIGLSSVAAIGAAAALPAGGSQDAFGRGGPGSGQFQPGRGQPQPGGQQLPGPGSQQPGVGQVPGGTVHVPGLGGDDDDHQSDDDGGTGAGSSTT